MIINIRGFEQLRGNIYYIYKYPPSSVQSNLNVVGKVSSILVSETIRIPIFPLTQSGKDQFCFKSSLSD